MRSMANLIHPVSSSLLLLAVYVNISYKYRWKYFRSKNIFRVYFSWQVQGKPQPKAKNIKQKWRNYQNKNDEKHKTKVAKNTR